MGICLALGGKGVLHRSTPLSLYSVASLPFFSPSNSDLTRCYILKIYRFPVLGMNAVVLAASLQEEENVIPQKRNCAPGEVLEGVALIAGAINSTPLQAASLGTFWAEPESTAPGRDPNRWDRAGTDQKGTR